MYALACRDGYQYSGPGPVYVTEIVPLASGLAAVASDQSLHLFHPLRLREGPSKRLRTDHGNVTAAKVYSFADSVVATAGENGTVSLWDLRLGPSAAHVLRLGEGGETSIVSLACSESTCALAAGTELAHSQASVLLWDIRHASAPRVRYNEIHSDDVTELSFHPDEAHVLLSGSTDGLVNVCDTRITDEDEVVMTAFNHGSVHHAGFLTATEIVAVSHDEKLAVYDAAEGAGGGGGQGKPAVADFGDARQSIGCQYVANISIKAHGAGAVIGAGSQDQERFQLVHLTKDQTWTVDKASAVGLPGAHGGEIVRSFCFFQGDEVVFTAGEDGCIKAWRPGS